MSVLNTGPLFLSRLFLNARSHQVISELKHPYEMHRTIMGAFPKILDETTSNPRDQFGVLVRAEIDEAIGAVKVYVQSRFEPNWSFLNAKRDYLSAFADMVSYAYKDIMPSYRRIHNEQVLSFRLRANPTKRVGKKDDPLKGKRVELYREADQIDWLMRKGREREAEAPGGFELLMKPIIDEKGEEQLIPRVNVKREGKVKGRKRSQRHETTHLSVLFDGLLRVTDPNAFKETLIYGIGPAKAFGFGLLSVAPVSAIT
jgi:CRISPR system Cascade subunit CasE